MKSVLLKLLKPKSLQAKWFILVTLIAIAILGNLGYFVDIRAFLSQDQLTLDIGSYSISLYSVARAAVVLALVFWITAIVSDEAELRIGQMSGMRAANRTIIIKVSQIVIYIIAILFAVDFMGVDLTTLTVFSGALGIGLGFGLQKIASNFISGLILLFERSIEEEDLVELSDGTFGFIRKARARFTLIETLDGKEILVPNEDLITSRVINWTYSSNKGRVEVNVGVSYGSDLHLAQSLIVEAALAHPRCIDDPAPKCFLREFGDSSINFILHFWVSDVTEGRWEPQSDVMFGIWEKFKANNIEIPFPQRDLHLRSSDIKLLEQGRA
ncbi:MAG: small-conductance mechanosensitive channel [Pseudohongiellaceae bacterium]|jgi:small-conductance mechanosensitive channel